MTYPTVVLIFAIFVVVFVLVWVVPQYVTMFEGMDASLPAITVLVIKFSNFLQVHMLGIMIILIIILSLYIYLFKNVRSFRLMMQTFYLHLPVVKNIIMYSEVSMFSRTFASLINHGVFITDSMDVLLNVSENEVYRKIIADTVKNLNAGGKISEAFKDHWAFPIVAYEMIVTGENTGQLGTMMDKVAVYYDNLHTNAVNSIKSLIEPILIVFLAGTVGIIILSIIDFELEQSSPDNVDKKLQVVDQFRIHFKMIPEVYDIEWEDEKFLVKFTLWEFDLQANYDINTRMLTKISYIACNKTLEIRNLNIEISANNEAQLIEILNNPRIFLTRTNESAYRKYLTMCEKESEE